MKLKSRTPNSLLGAKSLAAAALLLFLAGCGSAEDRAKQYYDSGMEYIEQKDYPKAAVEFRNALKLTEDYADAWYGMALVEQQARAWPRVHGDLIKVLEIDPKHLKALLALSTLQALGGDLQGALKNANTAAEVEPDNPDVMAHRASLLLKLDDRESALSEARRALQLKPQHPSAVMVIASEKLRTGDWAGALADAEAALAGNPNEMGLHLLKLSALEKSGDTGKQEAAIRALIATFPDRPEFRAGLVEFLVANKRSDAAESELREIAARQPDNSAAGMDLVGFVMRSRGAEAGRAELVKLAASEKNPFPYQLALADVEFAAGRAEQSEAMLRSLAQAQGVSDNGMAALLKLASQLIARKQYGAAKSVVADVLKNDGENAEALSQRGQLQIEAGAYEAAIEDLRAALNKNPKDYRSHGLLSLAYEHNGQIELALKSLDDATKISEYEPATALSYANFLIRRGREEGAEDLLRQMLIQKPENRDAMVLLAALLQRRGNWQGADEIARKLGAHSEGEGDANRILTRSLLQQKRFDEAIALLTQTAEKSPQDGEAMQTLVQSYLAAGKTAEAESFLAAVLSKDPDNAEALILRGKLYERADAVEPARQSFETAVARAPGLAAGYLALAEHFFRQNKIEDAIKILGDGIEKVESGTALRFALATIYERGGRMEDAIKEYEVIIAQESGQLLAVNNLASLLTDHRTDQPSLDRALALAAMLRNSPVPAFRETLGWSLVRSGRLKEGLTLLERTAPELPKNAAAQFHLGTAYAQAGDKVLAVKHLKLALELETAPAAKEKIEAALKPLGSTVQ